MNENNTSVYSQMAKEIDERFAATKMASWHDIEFPVRQHLDYPTMSSMVKNVTRTVFADNKYSPENLRYFFAVATLSYYTDLDLPYGDSEAMYRIVYGTDLMETVLRCISEAEYNSIWDAVNEHIDYRTSVAGQLGGVFAAINSLAEKVSETADAISPEDIKNISDALGKFESLDEAKLVSAMNDAGIFSKPAAEKE